jgi:hydrogenase expression/formation protein HypD
MKFVEEYRDAATAQRLAAAIVRRTTRPWTIMEVCGGQTHAIVRFGIDELLPKDITLIHGPGCPVCVTPVELIDKAVAIAGRPEVIFCSFGDMLRVPGSQKDLLAVKAAGGDVRIVYSPLDAVRLARENPGRPVVFFAVGFETTAPATALAVYQAARLGLENFSLLVSHVLVPPAMEALLSSPDNRVQGFLAAGHVCTVMGYDEYVPLAREYQVPIVVTGFEPVDILQGIYLCVGQLEEGRAEVENQYARAVRRTGNQPAQQLLREIFHVVRRKWRGLGQIPRSGLALSAKYAAFDAERRFGLEDIEVQEPPECIAGLVLQGIKKPHECSAFGTRCTPEHPLGAPMVSTEGACAAYYRYRRFRPQQEEAVPIGKQ